MPTSTSGGPAINTGNAAWDQGLGSLSAGLFPDPSKVAQAGYYGAEQRYKQLQGAQLQEQLAAGHQWLGITTGQMPGKPQYRTDPATGQNILADTAAVWGGSGGPALAPSAAPPGPAPISSAVVGPPPGPAPGPASAPAPASGFQGGGEGGGAGPPAVAPIANLIADSVSKASTSNSGPPLPAASPPAPGLPPAPNTTATDGSTPADNGAGILHPGSFTPAGGGVKTSGPAAPDGSPAPTAVNLGQLVALGVMKGMPAADAMGVARTVVAGWVKNGQMDQQHADDMLADLGETAMRVANITQTGATTRTGMEVAGRKDVAGMEVAGREKVAGMPTTFVADDPNDPTKGHYVPLSQQQGLGGTASFAPAATTTAAAPVTTQPVPGGPTFTSTQGQAQRSGTPLYQPVQETERGAADRQMAGINNAQVEVVDESSPTKTRVTTFADARTKGLQLTPKGQDQFGAQVQSAIVNAKTPEARQQIIDASSAAAAANKPPDANEDYHRQQLFDNELTKAYPLPDKASYGTEMAVPGLDPADENRIRNRADFLFNYSPDRSLHGNYSNAAARAIQEAKENGQLPTPEDLNAQRGQGGLRTIFGDVAGARPNVFTRTDLKGDQTDRFRIKTKAPAATDTNQTAPAGAIARAPAGAADGRKSINPPGVVRGGWVYPQ